MKRNFHLVLILLFSFLSILNANSQNNDSLIASQSDTIKSGYIIELDTAEVIIKVTDVNTGTETLLTQNDEIRVSIIGGNKESGRWVLIDENSIRVKQLIIPMSVIEHIEKSPRKYIIELDTAKVNLKVTTIESGKETLIKRKKKIYVVMVDGLSYLGQWEIIDENTIAINNVALPISDIEDIGTKMKEGGKAAMGIGIGVVVVGILAGAALLALLAGVLTP